MGARDLILRGLRTVYRAVEGEPRPGPYALTYSGGWLPDGAALNWWQQGHDPLPFGAAAAMVEACIGAYSQTVAMCPGSHWRQNSKGGRDRVSTSSLSRILKQPNAYQTISDFLMNAVRNLFLDGNAYALALRNDRFEVSEIHLMDSRYCKPMVAPETGEVFYRMAGNAVIDQQMYDQYPLVVPQRDVLHLRLQADRRYPYPLWGQTPLLAALADLSMIQSINSQQIQFYVNQARPSAVLSTDLELDKDQTQALRDRWDDQTRGINQGKTPVLTHGLKVMPWTVGGRDSQIAEMMKLSNQNIALVFRVPLPVLGMAGQTFGSTESLMQFWVSTGLGFVLNHIEQAFDLLFQLRGQPEEYTELSTDVLLRSALKDRIDALARGVQGGIYSPNEARNSEDLDSVKDGDEPRLQQQVVPLSAAANIGALPSPGGGAGPKSPHAPPAPPADGQPPAKPIPLKEPTDEAKAAYDVRQATRRIADGVRRASDRFH